MKKEESKDLEEAFLSIFSRSVSCLEKIQKVSHIHATNPMIRLSNVCKTNGTVWRKCT